MSKTTPLYTLIAPILGAFAVFGQSTGAATLVGSVTDSSGGDTEPKLLSKTDRSNIRKQIADLGLALPSVMESLRIAGPNVNKPGNLERLRAAAEMAHELSPKAPAVIETTLGGRAGAFDDLKREMADELAVWAKTLEPLKTVLAIKGHAATAMRRPENVLWMLDQVRSPWIRNVYDYSHYKVQGLDMRETMKQLVPGAVFIHVKDGVGTAPNHRFLLPGDSKEIDYKEYVKILAELRYTGPVLVEVSVHVFDQPGYDGIAAAKRCWENVGSIIGV